jgi:parvulin-like peptidyl-prolyl isomerase
MSFMESIRNKGQYFLLAFLVIFVITLFFGLTGGSILNPADLIRNKGAATDGQGGRSAILLPEGKLADAAILVNGKAVGTDIYDDLVRRFTEMLNRQGSDAENVMTAYGYAVNALADQEAKLQEAQRLGLKVSEAALAKAKRDASAQFLPSESKTTGNVVGDLVKDYNDARALKSAFAQYLQTVGLNEEQWEKQSLRELLVIELQNHIKARYEEEEKAEIDKRKAEVDDGLSKGTPFADLADKYSDDAAQSGKGGDVGVVGWGLLQDEKQREEIFKTEKGKVSEWIETEAGWQKVEVYDKKEAKGPDFDAAKAGIIASLKDQKKDQSGYEPTEDEIKREYEQVSIRQIMLRKKAQQKAAEEEDKIAQAASVEVNNSYALAWQASSSDKMQPPASFGYEKLVELAKQNSALAEGYDFGPLQAKIENGKPKPVEVEASETGDEPGKKADASAAADASAGAGDPVADGENDTDAGGSASGGDDVGTDESATTKEPGAEADGDPPADTAGSAEKADTVSMGEAAEDAKIPMYAVSIALLTKGLADGNGAGGSFAHFMIAKIYMDWMDDVERLKTQPIDREKARQSIEDHLKAAAESDNYNAGVHAVRGLNLARMDKKDEADKSLQLAMKYVSDEDTESWDTIKEAYEVMDDSAKIAEVDTKLSEIRQKKLQEMINQSMRDQQAKDESGQASGGAVQGQ